jgi:hypothetical protein
MKKLLKFANFFLIVVIVFTSCKKEKQNTIVVSPSLTPPVSGISPCSSKEYDLNITGKDTFSVEDNYTNPWDYIYPPNYYDLTILPGNAVLQPFGEVHVEVLEYADIGLSNNIAFTDIAVYSANPYVLYLFLRGNCSINFKKLIKEGGGVFNGIFTVTSGFAKACDLDRKVFTNVPPLTVIGSLDVTTRIVTLNIKGKVYL